MKCERCGSEEYAFLYDRTCGDCLVVERDEAREIVLELIPLVKGFFDGRKPGFPFGIAMRIALLPWLREAIGRGKFT